MSDAQPIGVVLNVFNRYEHAIRTAQALCVALRQLSSPSRVIVVVDGPRTPEETAIVESVRRAVCDELERQQVRFDVHTFTENQGLSKAVRFGADKIFLKTDYAVFVEDDIEFSPVALQYFERMRLVRNRRKDVWSVSGFTHLRPTRTGRSWLSAKFSSWGWATWKDRWLNVNWSTEYLAEFVEQRSFCDISPAGYAFNAWFGSDTIPVAIDTLAGRTDSWAIKFMVNAMQHGGTHVYAPVPLVSNWGWDGSGRHCPAGTHLQATPVSQYLPTHAAELMALSWPDHVRYIHFRALLPNKWTNRYHRRLRAELEVMR